MRLPLEGHCETGDLGRGPGTISWDTRQKEKGPIYMCLFFSIHKAIYASKLGYLGGISWSKEELHTSTSLGNGNTKPYQHYSQQTIRR